MSQNLGKRHVVNLLEKFFLCFFLLQKDQILSGEQLFFLDLGALFYVITYRSLYVCFMFGENGIMMSTMLLPKFHHANKKVCHTFK